MKKMPKNFESLKGEAKLLFLTNFFPFFVLSLVGKFAINNSLIS
jgi:hypothetical protein